jgi:hypothetical protein
VDEKIQGETSDRNCVLPLRKGPGEPKGKEGTVGLHSCSGQSVVKDNVNVLLRRFLWKLNIRLTP